MKAVPSPRVLTRTLLLASIAVAMAATPLVDARAKTDERATSSRAVSIASVTTQDFRAAVVATRVTGGATPTADVRVAIAQRSAGRWREKGETRLTGTYFWRTVTGPRAICKLELATASSPQSPYVAIRLLQSPSLGCGRTHRIPLPAR
jgi:hypothetical protein